jgi:hypothetical protein
VLILVGACLYVFKSCRDLPGESVERATQLVRQVGEEARQVAAAFRQGSISTTFTSYATELNGSQHLQFATLNQQELFTRTDDASVAFGYIPLPEVVVEAQAPVTYTYYLDLNAAWDFRLEDGVIYVEAPEIRFNKPAVDVSRMTYETKKKSLLRDTDEAMENLKRSITWMSYQKARSNIGLVQETGRKQTEMFVENWLSRMFVDGKKYPVKVRFRNEAGAGPTLRPGTGVDPSVK